MKKILNVLLVVLAVILAFKFLTSSFFIYMVIFAAVPQVIRYLCKNGVITKRGIYRNAYRYTAIGIIVLAVIRLIFAHSLGISFLIGGLAGVAISILAFDEIAKK